MGIDVAQSPSCEAATPAECSSAGRVFTTGWETLGGDTGYGTVAYDATTGDQLWTSRYNPGAIDEVYDIGASADGQRVFLTGRCCGSWTGGSIVGWKYATVAYDAVTGEELWSSKHDGEEFEVTDHALSLDVAPDGQRVYVTGVSGRDALTIAYDAQSGAEAWRATYAGPEGGIDQGFEVVASSDGRRVFVAGGSWGGGADSNYDYLVVAYEAADPERLGEELWAARLDNGARGFDVAQTLAASADGSHLVASGIARVSGTTAAGLYANYEFLTVALDATTGEIGWTARYAGDAGGLNGANDVVIAPDGETAFVTGISTSAQEMDLDIATIAYDAYSGEQSWEARLATPGHWSEFGNRIGITPDGSRVFVSGSSLGVQGNTIVHGDTVTLAYEQGTGEQSWVARQNTSPASVDISFSGFLAVAPSGDHVYSAGMSLVRGTGGVFVTMAYPVIAPLELPLPRGLRSSNPG